MADFPWYGLDEAFTGPRWLGGRVQRRRHGRARFDRARRRALGQGGRRPGQAAVRGRGDRRGRTRPAQRGRHGRAGGHLGVLGGLAGRVGAAVLHLAPQLDHALRDDWLDQQTADAWDLADDLAGSDWSTLSLPVDGVPTPFHYRESEFGWVLAGVARGGSTWRLRARDERVRSRVRGDQGHHGVPIATGQPPWPRPRLVGAGRSGRRRARPDDLPAARPPGGRGARGR